MHQNQRGATQVVCVETTFVPGPQTSAYHAEIVIGNGATYVGTATTKCQAVAVAVRKACKDRKNSSE